MTVAMDSVPVRSSLDGPRITVDTFLKDPYKIQALVFAMMDQQILADAVLRTAGPIESGAIQYMSETPYYADDDTMIRGEFGEVPVLGFSEGIPKVTFVAERAGAILISDRMRRRRNVDPVNTQLLQLKNTMIKNWDDAFVSATLRAATQVVDNGSAWGSEPGTGTYNMIRRDILAARRLIGTAKAAGQNTAYGFKADTLIIGEESQWDILAQDDFNKPYAGNLASENVLYTGVLPNKISNLDVMVSRQLPDDFAIVMQRKVAGFIGDELPLQTSALYRDEPRKTWRADVQRASGIGFDQPKSMAIIKIKR